MPPSRNSLLPRWHEPMVPASSPVPVRPCCQRTDEAQVAQAGSPRSGTPCRHLPGLFPPFRNRRRQAETLGARCRVPPSTGPWYQVKAPWSRHGKRMGKYSRSCRKAPRCRGSRYPHHILVKHTSQQYVFHWVARPDQSGYLEVEVVKGTLVGIPRFAEKPVGHIEV